MQCRSRYKYFRTHSSPDIVRYRSVQHPTRVPLLSKCHRQLRLQWAREYQDWTMNKWKKVFWSHVSRFLIHHVDGLFRVQRLFGEHLLHPCTADHKQAGVSGHYTLKNVMMWSSMTFGCRRADYESSALSECISGWCAPSHVRLSLQLAMESSSRITNLLEHICDVMELQVRAKTPPCRNISALRPLLGHLIQLVSSHLLKCMFWKSKVTQHDFE